MNKLCYLFLVITILIGCQSNNSVENNTIEVDKKLPVIFDTDANNELDDQHALAYLFQNQNYFDIKGVTVNATFSGGDIDNHLEEADRVMHLCGVKGKIPLLKGANNDFDSIRPTIDQGSFDGSDAVNFIIEQALKVDSLILLPVGKLTNIALAIEKAPEISERIRIVWLGSNYPEKGEYNLENDISAMNYLLEKDVHFEMVTVRYGNPSGSYHVQVTPEDITNNFAGKGPKVTPVEGRHGGMFENFGDYAIDLFKNAELYGNPPSRSLYDLVAVAIVKNADWGQSTVIPAPIMEEEEWVERPNNKRSIVLWDNFDKDSILKDFYDSFK